MSKTTKALLLIALTLFNVHTLYPPRINPLSPDEAVDRAYIFSEKFRYSFYHEKPHSEGNIIISRPAQLDLTSYLTQTILLISISATLIIALTKTKS